MKNEVEIVDFGMIDSNEKAYETGPKFLAANVDVIFCNIESVITTNLPKYEAKAGLWFTKDIVEEYVLSGAWQYRNRAKTVIFAVNIFNCPAEYKITFNAKEYGICEENEPKEFVYDGIPYIATTNAVMYSTANPARKDGDKTEVAFDMVTLNRKTRTLNVLRVGWGEDRTFTWEA